MVRPVIRRVQRESEGNGRPSFSQRMVGFGYPDATQGSSTMCPTCTSPDWKLSSTDGVDSVGSVETCHQRHLKQSFDNYVDKKTDTSHLYSVYEATASRFLIYLIYLANSG